jgi:hypothetical protein
LDNGWRRPLTWMLPALSILLVLSQSPGATLASESYPIERPEFQDVWDRTEAPVASGDTPRSWLWGPAPRTEAMVERYLESPGEERTVQYFDKGRMEINDPSADPSDPWFVTSGLLTRELISGRIQVGDDAFLDTGAGASIQVAGDHMNPFPQYRHLADIVDSGNPDRTGDKADKVLTPNGIDPAITPPDDPQATFANYIVYHGPDGQDVGYNIPTAFWDYLNAPGTVFDQAGNPVTADPLFNWIFVMGFPIADAFWAEVPVGGNLQWVLIQPFERRVLTYTPGNNPEWQVEMGNIGQHYRDWRSQYFAFAENNGDSAEFALYDSADWRFRITTGGEELWEMSTPSSSFIPGSTVYARDEFRAGLRTTYWSTTEDGLFLHGWDLRDGQRNLVDMVVYSPALHVLPGEWTANTVLETEVDVISLLSDPVTETIRFHLTEPQFVLTYAAVFQTWRVETTDFSTPAVRHDLGQTFWFEPEIGTVMWRFDSQASAMLLSSSLLDSEN